MIIGRLVARIALSLAARPADAAQRHAGPRRCGARCRRCWSRPSASPRRWRRACTAAAASARARPSGSSATTSRATRVDRIDWRAVRRARHAPSSARPNGRRRRPSGCGATARASMDWRSRGAAGRTSASAPSCCCWRSRRCCCAAASGCSLIGSGQPRGVRPGRARPAGRAAGRSRRDGDGLPPASLLPRHAQVVLIGDFLAPLRGSQAVVGRMAAVPGHRPSAAGARSGRGAAAVRRPRALRLARRRPGGGLETLIPRVEGVREAYAERLAMQQDGLAAHRAAAGWSFSVHRTDQPPETALLALYTALAPEPATR